MKYAYFVKEPSTCEDLLRLHLKNHEQPYEITCTTELRPIGYENFYYGLDADRQYIEDHAPLCSDGPVKKCLLVRQRGKSDGILVVPNPKHPCYVLWAAYYNPS